MVIGFLSTLDLRLNDSEKRLTRLGGEAKSLRICAQRRLRRRETRAAEGSEEGRVIVSLAPKSTESQRSERGGGLAENGSKRHF